MKKYVLLSLLTSLTVLLILLTTAEIALRIEPAIIGQDFANGVLTPYSARPEGIYYRDHASHMNHMKPNYEYKAYYNGYTWTHSTDARGYRNPPGITDPEILLLGDSFIYGHAAEINETVRHFLTEITGKMTYSMARQGDCAFQQSYIYTQEAQQFSPEYVVYFFFSNDISDLDTDLSKVEQQEFLATIPGNITYNEKNGPTLGTYQEPAKKLYLSRAKDYLLEKRRTKILHDEALANTQTPSHEQSELLAWKYTKHAILHMHTLAEHRGAKFIIAPIFLSGSQNHREILEDFAQENNITILNTRQVQDNAANFLPFDGHFTPRGARAMALAVSQGIE